MKTPNSLREARAYVGQGAALAIVLSALVNCSAEEPQPAKEGPAIEGTIGGKAVTELPQTFVQLRPKNEAPAGPWSKVLDIYLGNDGLVVNDFSKVCDARKVDDAKRRLKIELRATDLIAGSYDLCPTSQNDSECAYLEWRGADGVVRPAKLGMVQLTLATDTEYEGVFNATFEDGKVTGKFRGTGCAPKLGTGIGGK